MPRFLIKPDRDEDWYVLWSTVVDGPTYFGTRAALSRHEFAAERFDRADATGTSALVGDPPWYSWAEAATGDRTMMVYCCGPGVLQRADLRAFCDAFAADDEASAVAFLTPFEEHEARRETAEPFVWWPPAPPEGRANTHNEWAE